MRKSFGDTDSTDVHGSIYSCRVFRCSFVYPKENKALCTRIQRINTDCSCSYPRFSVSIRVPQKGAHAHNSSINSSPFSTNMAPAAGPARAQGPCPTSYPPCSHAAGVAK